LRARAYTHRTSRANYNRARESLATRHAAYADTSPLPQSSVNARARSAREAESPARWRCRAGDGAAVQMLARGRESTDLCGRGRGSPKAAPRVARDSRTLRGAVTTHGARRGSQRVSELAAGGDTRARPEPRSIGSKPNQRER